MTVLKKWKYQAEIPHAHWGSKENERTKMKIDSWEQCQVTDREDSVREKYLTHKYNCICT